MTTLGFVGLGHMGGNMAVRFLGAGYTVYGETRHRGEVQDLESEGLVWRDTPREIAEAADVVLTSVPTDSVLEDVASGPDGILAGLVAGKVWIDVSTVSPHVSRDLAQRVSERGAAMLDAPVSGSVPQVQTGTLTIMGSASRSPSANASICTARLMLIAELEHKSLAVLADVVRSPELAQDRLDTRVGVLVAADARVSTASGRSR